MTYNPERVILDDMDAKEFVEWDSRFSIGIPQIDAQHKQLILMTNKLYKACQYSGDSAKEQFRATIREAVGYIRYHFTSEEKIMERIEYPGMEDHKREHRDFIQEVLEQVKDFEEGKRFVPHMFVRFLRDWVLSHIALTDTYLGEYLLHQRRGDFSEGYAQGGTAKPASE